MNKYEWGTVIRITGEFRDISNVLVDPTVVIFETKDPTGLFATNYTVVKDNTGLYHADITTAKPSGRWAYRWEGRGNLGVSYEGEFSVLGTDF
jgi:hypothetical protein